MKNKIVDLRDHLFATLEALRDPEKPMELDRAKAIAEVAQVVVDSAKVECDFLKIMGGTTPGTGFIPDGAPQITGLGAGTAEHPRLVKGKASA